jgi:hypothetical protein
MTTRKGSDFEKIEEGWSEDETDKQLSQYRGLMNAGGKVAAGFGGKNDNCYCEEELESF